MSNTLRRSLSVSIVLMTILLSAAACQEQSAPAPTPTPALTVDDLLSTAGEKLAAMSTAKFKMVDETESGAKFFETTFKSMEADVKVPDSFRMLVDADAPIFGYVQIEMLAVGDQAYIKLSKDLRWGSLPLESVPFNFAGLGTTLRDLLTTMKDGAIVGTEPVSGDRAIRVEGNIASEDLSTLITSADAGHTLALTLWIDEVERALRQIRIAGQVYDDDAPDTSRLLTIEDIDVPVEIEAPDLSSAP